MHLILPLLAVSAFAVGVIALALSIYNFFRMTQEVRSRSGWVSLIPYIAFAFPGALTTAGEMHRTKASRWMLVAGVCAAVAVGARFLGDR